jgi:hypothetical protein
MRNAARKGLMVQHGHTLQNTSYTLDVFCAVLMEHVSGLSVL